MILLSVMKMRLSSSAPRRSIVNPKDAGAKSGWLVNSSWDLASRPIVTSPVNVAQKKPSETKGTSSKLNSLLLNSVLLIAVTW